LKREEKLEEKSTQGGRTIPQKEKKLSVVNLGKYIFIPKKFSSVLHSNRNSRINFLF